MILCFSGTGNSRYIARRIAEAFQDAGECSETSKGKSGIREFEVLEDTEAEGITKEIKEPDRSEGIMESKEISGSILDLNSRIKAQDFTPVETGPDVVLVTPTYAWRIPRIVSEWLSKATLVGAERIWFVMNCGSEIGNAAKYNRGIAEAKGLRYMGTAQVVMPENYIALFNAPQVGEARRIVAAAEPDIEEVIACVRAGRAFGRTRGNLYDRFMSGPVNPVFYRVIVGAGAFRADERCTGCGECVRRCPMNNVRLRDGRPVWGAACTHCMACICYCPAEAVEYGKRSMGKPRYRFEALGK